MCIEIPAYVYVALSVAIIIASVMAVVSMIVVYGNIIVKNQNKIQKILKEGEQNGKQNLCNYE